MPDMTFQALDPTGLNETAEQVRAIVQEAKSEIEAELDSLDYAQPDGIYPEMTVGAVIGADETAQWATRESEGTGSAIVRSVQGAAVTWNQLLDEIPDDLTQAAIIVGPNGTATIVSSSNNGVTISSSSQYYGIYFKHRNNIIGVSGHKYLGLCTVTTEVAASMFFVFGGESAWTEIPSGTSSFGAIAVCNDDTAINPSFRLYKSPAAELVTTIRNCMVFDLTAMFGSGNEPTTVAEFERMYPEAYYPYSAPTLKPVQISGFRSTDAQGGELDAIEWPAQELWGVGDTRDELTSDAVLHRIRTLVLDGTEADMRSYTYAGGNAKGYAIVDVLAVDEVRPNFVSSVPFQMWGPDTWCWLGINSKTVYLLWAQDNLPYATVDDFRAWLASLNANGTPLTFAYVTSQPTTQPIRPALAMSYKVEQGGTETIIVPDGEVSAAPIITIAEPVNMSTELAQIWAAIEALQGSRGSALGSVRSDSDVSSTEVKEAPTMDERQTTERESEI